MSSRRKDRGGGSEELQLWYGIRTHLRQLETIGSSSPDRLVQLETSKSDLDKISKKISDLENQRVHSNNGSRSSVNPGQAETEEHLRKDYENRRENLFRLFGEAKGKTIEEQLAIDGALEKIGILNALMSAPEVSLPDNNKRKKRRTDAASPAPSRSPSIQPVPPPVTSGGVHEHKKSLSIGTNEQKRIPPIQFSTNKDRVSSSSSSSSLSNSTTNPHHASSHSSNSSNPNSRISSGPNNISTPSSSASSNNKDSKSNSSSNSNFNLNVSSAPSTPSIRKSNSSNHETPSNIGAGKDGSHSSSSKDSHMDPAKARREALAHQLPLQKGRRVAFRQPVKKPLNEKGGSTPNKDQFQAAVEDEGETWIMATVIECINNDRNRYVVQDDAPEDHSGPLPIWNTTLKAVVPLPININTLPEKDYPVGSQVMGLYPDTSCFYRAIIKGGGPGMEQALRGNPAKLVKREQELLNSNYQLVFEDDNDDIKLVPAYLVVERPGGGY